MERLVDGWPVWAVFVVFFVGAVVRGLATYAVGRGLRAGGERSRLAARLDHPLVGRAEGWVTRWGIPVVALGFLTVGVQSAINVAAGTVRMPLRRFVVGVVLGGFLWAVLYTTVGLAVVGAWLGRASWWWGLVGAGVVVAVWALSRRLERE